ncbi:hypothetical protein AB0L81_27290, partial [Streptomyces sp. NPDC052127]
MLAELRGRYPRHPWPEDPAAAGPGGSTRPSSGRLPRIACRRLHRRALPGRERHGQPGVSRHPSRLRPNRRRSSWSWAAGDRACCAR